MNPIEELKNEHEAVKMTLKILNRICNKIEHTGEIPSPEHVEQLLEFFVVFIDKCHHGKEEDLLFPAMEKVGISRENGPIGVMLAEHQRGRDLVKKMEVDLLQYKAGSTKAALSLREHAGEYIALLNHHIEKENSVLFPMAVENLSKPKLSNMKDGFDKIETDRIGVGRHEKFHRMLGDLKERYLM